SFARVMAPAEPKYTKNLNPDGCVLGKSERAPLSPKTTRKTGCDVYRSSRAYDDPAPGAKFRSSMMARASCTFRQRDVTAAVKAALAAGVEVARVEVDKAGKIVIVAKTDGEQTTQVKANGNPWDTVYEQH